MVRATGSHRAPVNGSRRPARLATAVLATLIIVAGLAIGIGRLATSGGQTAIDTADTAARAPLPSSQSSDEPSNEPSSQPGDGASATAVDSPTRSPKPAKPRATRVKPAHVVRGLRLVHLTPAEIEARKAAARARELASREVSFTIGTLNVLGSQHTGPHGDDHRGWPAASWRTGQQAAYIKSHGVDVVGLQEAKPDQLDGLMRLTGFKAFPGYQFGKRDTDNSILYDPDKFEFVSGTSFKIVFMHGPRPQTVLRLRDKDTGREMYFINMHTSAGHDGAHTATRHAGMATAVNYINSLKSQGLPIFVTGDMNDREPFKSRVLGPADLTAPIFHGWHSRIYGPGWLAVDWIAGSPQVSWSDYWVEILQKRKISDHYFITAHATIPGAD
ncbi:endonuclease/exonuclease/phosphatase family protein [Nocardioides sp. DS6]|uniref:Endonuclease/exonuclease/phosphatase family protein n=1 Tax=Nocardioides eburneus TaxID=3231482 RepID=A0ABV3T2D5_9ACTN